VDVEGVTLAKLIDTMEVKKECSAVQMDILDEALDEFDGLRLEATLSAMMLPNRKKRVNEPYGSEEYMLRQK
jgi:hypothetical protein